MMVLFLVFKATDGRATAAIYEPLRKWLSRRHETDNKEPGRKLRSSRNCVCRRALNRNVDDIGTKRCEPKTCTSILV